MDEHGHRKGFLERPTAGILERGLSELLDMTRGLEFQPMNSTRFPLPLAAAVFGRKPGPENVRKEVVIRMKRDPVDALEPALVLLELAEGNRPEAAGKLPDDGNFLGHAFNTKRMNAWAAVLGDVDRRELERAVNARWKFSFLSGTGRRTGVYPLLNMMARYAFVYGRIAEGDFHSLTHFVEDFGPGLLICRGRMDDLELTLSLAAMKMGVPAVTGVDYPFSLGRHVRVATPDAIGQATAAFPNIRRLLDFPDLPKLPDYLDQGNVAEKFEPASVWGNTPESFYLLRKGKVSEPSVRVSGEPSGHLGIVLTAHAEPMDAFDLDYLEPRPVSTLSMMAGVKAELEDGRIVLSLAKGAEPAGARLGETLIAALRREFPKLAGMRAEVIFDPARLRALSDEVRAEKESRREAMARATEENVQEFCTCVGCSPFAPDHVCIPTPERPPQCGRPYQQIKAGALYGFDDMSSIHHRPLHANLNSFGTTQKGELLDAKAGEWSGVNAAAARLTGNRTNRIRLHSVDEAPHTGCGCFWMVMFRTDKPEPGIGIMDRWFTDRAPDGRSWEDLYYVMAGKQSPGHASASFGYLFSRKFLAGDGGWGSVVWVSPKVAQEMGEKLPPSVKVG